MGYRDVCKVVIGAAIWDFLIALYCIIAAYYPVDFFWIPMGLGWLIAVAGIDLVIIAALSYCAWFY